MGSIAARWRLFADALNEVVIAAIAAAKQDYSQQLRRESNPAQRYGTGFEFDRRFENPCERRKNAVSRSCCNTHDGPKQAKCSRGFAIWATQDHDVCAT